MRVRGACRFFSFKEFSMVVRLGLTCGLAAVYFALCPAGVFAGGEGSTVGQTVPAAVLETALPDEVERKIDEQTEHLPDEVRDKIREQIKEAVRKKLDKLAEKAEDSLSESDEEEATDSTTNGEEGEKAAAGAKEEGKEKSEEESKSDPKQDAASEEAKRMRTEIELFDTQYKYRVAKYKKELEEQRILIEKIKIDSELENERRSSEIERLKSELARMKMESDTIKQRIALEKAKLELELAEASIRNEHIDAQLASDDAQEKMDDRVLTEERYPDNPLEGEVLTISDRRIELNGPIMTGAARYVCERIDFFNNQSSKPIFLVIDSSPGGSAIEGFQIVQALRKSKAPVHVVVKRYAASMAAIIATLADHSYCYPDSILLHHQASAMVGGNGRDLKDQLERFNEISRRLVGGVAKKLGISEEEFINQMYANRSSGDWDLFGDEALERKWVGHVVQTIREESVRSRPKGELKIPSFFQLGLQSEAKAPVAVEIPEYADRYEVHLTEQVDDKGHRYVRLPRTSPLDAWLIYNPDNYYR
jgi:ATP-dependent Clp protease protease subunit